jgi:uncharacterized protein YfaS (alpha-2-macroglobulin family)
VSTNTDRLAINGNYLSYQYDYDAADKNKLVKVEFFLDRAIYRPGQTVYYKGIYIKKNSQSTVVPTTSFTVTIKGPNGLKSKNLISLQMISDLLMGEFILPATGLTGNYTMQSRRAKDYEKDEHPFWDNVDLSYSTINFNVGNTNDLNLRSLLSK